MDHHAAPELDIPMPAPFAAGSTRMAQPMRPDAPAFPRLATPMRDAMRRAAEAPAPQPVVVGGGPAAAHAPPTAEAQAPAAAQPHADERVSAAIAAQVVEQATSMPAGPSGVRLISPPSFAYDLLASDDDTVHDGELDLHALPTRALLHEALRAKLVAIIEQHEHRSAYEIVFLLLAFAVTVLLVTPPIVQVLLAARGVQS